MSWADPTIPTVDVEPFWLNLQISDDKAREFPHFPTPLPVELQLWRQRCLEGRSPKPPQETNCWSTNRRVYWFHLQICGTDFDSKNFRQTNRIWDCLALPDNVLLPKIKITWVCDLSDMVDMFGIISLEWFNWSEMSQFWGPILEDSASLRQWKA